MSEPYDLDATESEALRRALNPTTPLNKAIRKFAWYQASQERQRCVGAMRSVPRQLEHASDAAAKEQAYAQLINNLEAFAASYPGANPGR